MQATRAERHARRTPEKLAINLVKRPRIPKAALPHFIDRLDRVRLTLALRTAHHRLHGPPPHTILMLIHELADLVAEELVGPSAFPAERTRAYLVAHEGGVC
jgi:hypothetical protein